MTDKQRCGNCGAPATRLCDHQLVLALGEKVGPGARLPTCDSAICDDCAQQIGSTFYCGSGGCDTDSVDRCVFHARARMVKVRTGGR